MKDLGNISEGQIIINFVLNLVLRFNPIQSVMSDMKIGPVKWIITNNLQMLSR